jgi:hypothetical protein
VKKHFLQFTLSVILSVTCGAGLAVGEDSGRKDKDRKETARIIVVEKKERDKDKSGSGEMKERRPDDRKPRP